MRIVGLTAQLAEVEVVALLADEPRSNYVHVAYAFCALETHVDPSIMPWQLWITH